MLAIHGIESELEEMFRVQGMRREYNKALQDVYT
jgi:hypothetical protein